MTSQQLQQHLFLSPHADDAALSCGGQIATLVRQGNPVTILTLMIAEPPREALTLPLATYFHQKWGLGEEVVTVRRTEDRAAAQRLGAQLCFGDLLEAGYRRTEAGDPCYMQPDSIHEAPNPHDPLLQLLTPDAVAELLQAAQVQVASGMVIHAPLGVGNHVDHQIVREMALVLAKATPDLKVIFYEDYPYASWNDQVVPSAVRALTPQIAPRSLRRMVYPLTLWARLRRMAAIASYKSQLKMIWPRGTLGMIIRTWQFMNRMGGEAEWELA